jgi:hypothetical protein
MTIHWKQIGTGVLIGIVATWTISNFGAYTKARGETQAGDLGIADLAQRVRTDLEQMEAHRLASGKDAVFQLKDFDLEISFVVKVNRKSKGEISTEVVTVGAENEAGRENAHKVTLHMTPIPTQRFDTPPTAAPISAPHVIELPTEEVK